MLLKNLLPILFLITCIYIKGFESTTEVSFGTECPEVCDQNECPVPQTECLAGLVKDNCDCCFVCGRREGQRCFDKSFEDQLPEDYPHYQRCGDDLECRVRTDLDPSDKPEAICYCTQDEPICGSDGVTYENRCQFTEARYRNRDKLYEIDNRPCKSMPKITSPPEDTTNNTGSSVAFSCEAWGWPLPSIDWRLERDGQEISISGKHFDIKSNQSSNYAVISWLQLMDAQREDSGTYLCVASNSEGEDKASAYLTIGYFKKRFDLVEE